MITKKHADFRELVADQGKLLTQAAEVAAENRIYAKAVALGKGGRADAWAEVDAAEADPEAEE